MVLLIWKFVPIVNIRYNVCRERKNIEILELRMWFFSGYGMDSRLETKQLDQENRFQTSNEQRFDGEN